MAREMNKATQELLDQAVTLTKDVDKARNDYRKLTERRAKVFARLANKGVSHAAIGRATGITQQSVTDVIRRVEEGKERPSKKTRGPKTKPKAAAKAKAKAKSKAASTARAKGRSRVKKALR